MPRRCLAVVLTLSFATAVFAQAPATSLGRIDLLPRQGTSDPAITPIYSQLFLYALPDEFHTVSGGVTRKGHFAQQSVPAGQSLQRWTQMITVSGDEALAFSGRTYPQKMVEDFAARMKKNCPASFAMLPLANVFVGSYDTVVAVASCGSTGGQSESVLQMVIKGGMDMYTLEWAVRGPPSRGPLQLDAAQWTDRLRRLAPVRLCSVVANEQPPFPSCVNRR